MRPFLMGILAIALPFSGSAIELNPAGIGTPVVYPPAAPKPFVAKYTVSRNGKAMGESSMSLRDDGDGRWSLSSETRGTSGVARLVGLEVSERSQFRWGLNELPEALVYDYAQEAAIKSKTRHADFDWQSAQARVSDGKKHYEYAIEPGTMDRHCVGLALARSLAAGSQTTISLDVAVKDHVEHQRFEVAATEDINLPAGSFSAQRVERVDVSGKGRSWFVPAQFPVPVRVEQTQGDGATIVMELASFNAH